MAIYIIYPKYESGPIDCYRYMAQDGQKLLILDNNF